MTCPNHGSPQPDCIGCLGRWDRAAVQRVIDEYLIYGIAKATIRGALAEVDRLETDRDAARRWLTTTVRIARLLRGRLAESDAAFQAVYPRCNDLDAFHDGELDPVRAAAFRDHLARCPACEAALLGRIQEHAAVSASLERRDAVVDAAVAWVRAGGTLAALAAAVNNMEDGNG